MLKNEEQKAKEIFRIHIDGSPRDQKVLDGFFFSSFKWVVMVRVLNLNSIELNYSDKV